jgi:hypothetical protein
MAAIDNRGGPVDPACGIQPSQELTMQTLPHPSSLPGGQPAMRGRGRAAHLRRKMPPGDPREQHEHDRVEAHTIIHTRTPATRIRRMLREQRLHRLPQLVPHPPNRARHRAPPSPGYVTQKVRPSTPKPCPRKVLRQLLSHQFQGGHRMKLHANARTCPKTDSCWLIGSMLAGR